MRLVGPFLALVVAGSTLAPVAAADTAHGEAPSGRLVPATKTAVRSYGDGPVRQDGPQQVVKVQFRATKGNRVALRSSPGNDAGCAKVTLHRGARKIAKQGSGYWWLRLNGDYTFTYRPCARAKRLQELQLTRLTVMRPEVDGPPSRMPERRGFEYAARVVVPETGRVAARLINTRKLRGILGPTGRFTRLYDVGSPLYFEAGRKVADRVGRLEHGALLDVPSRPGDTYLLFARARTPVQLSTPVQHAGVVDGAPVQLATGDVRSREQAVVFDGRDGQWLRYELTPGAGWPATGTHVELTDAEGDAVPTTGSRVWQLPSDGRYRLTVDPDVTGANLTAELRLRSIRVLPELRPDAGAVTFTTAEPGEWMVAPLALAEDVRPAYRLRAVAAAMSDDWFATAAPPVGVDCGRYPPSGCRPTNGVLAPTLPGYPVSNPFQSRGTPSWHVLVRPDDGVTGSVTLSVETTP